MTSPTEAHQEMVTLLHGVLVEVARRRQDDLPGLVESLQDDVLLATGGTTRPAYGWFAPRIWRYGERRVHELFLNADFRTADPTIGIAEEMLVTAMHEACHVWAHANDIADTSRGGRYHNRRFAEIALAIGLAVEKHAVIGHHTPSLSPGTRVQYADLLAELKRGLVLAREPHLINARTSSPETSTEQESSAPATASEAVRTKYVFASCQCQAGKGRAVTIRVAIGSWRDGVIYCSVCQNRFNASL